MVNINRNIILITTIITTIFLLVLLALIFRAKPTTTLTIITEPEDAAVFIDNKKTSSNKKTHVLEPGEHGIMVEKEGYVTGEETVILEKDKHETITITLDPYLSTFLPENNENFKIEEKKENDTKVIEVTLYGIFNRPDQLEQYKEELREHQAEAKSWLEERGVNLNKANIRWIPEEKYFKP